jgi:hypothetical protein
MLKAVFKPGTEINKQTNQPTTFKGVFYLCDHVGSPHVQVKVRHILGNSYAIHQRGLDLAFRGLTLQRWGPDDAGFIAQRRGWAAGEGEAGPLECCVRGI